jgi:hypothetical protein
MSKRNKKVAYYAKNEELAHEWHWVNICVDVIKGQML